MEQTSNMTSDNCQSLAPNAQNGPSSKMQKTSAIEISTPHQKAVPAGGAIF